MADAPRKNRKVNGHGGGPIGGFQKPKETKKTVKRLLSYMGQHPVMLIVAFLCVIASALASVGATYITRPSTTSPQQWPPVRPPCPAWGLRCCSCWPSTSLPPPATSSKAI